MHISEGILSGPVLATGWALTSLGVYIGLRKIRDREIPKAGLMASVFFVASLIHIPVGPASAHLLLIGLVGILLGWVSFPAIFVGLVLQALLFQFGGITVLGVNTCIMAIPAIIVYGIFRPVIFSQHRSWTIIGSFLAGALAILLSAIICSIFLVVTQRSFLLPAKLIILAHLPIMVVEGILTYFVIQFLKKVRPEILEVSHV